MKTDHEEAAEEVDVAAATEKTDALATESLAIPEPLTRYLKLHYENLKPY